jgi:hypothetical protein
MRHIKAGRAESGCPCPALAKKKEETMAQENQRKQEHREGYDPTGGTGSRGDLPPEPPREGKEKRMFGRFLLFGLALLILALIVSVFV